MAQRVNRPYPARLGLLRPCNFWWTKLGEHGVECTYLSRERGVLDMSRSIVTPHAAVLNHLRVLYVEDSVDDREVFKVLFEQGGAEVTIAGTVREALDAFDCVHPELIVSDIGLPD